jgi:2-phosphosulfolactate phosphatase
VAVAAGRGASILPFAWKDATARRFARTQRAVLAGKRGTARYSLSPLSFLEAPAGLRCVLPSPNGAALALQAAASPSVVFAGCLRNASAVAEAARRAGATFNVCPAGERWPDGSLRPAIEDWLAAGAILRWLPGTKSPEAETAVNAFLGARHTLPDLIARSSSGRELILRGYAADVTFATEYDADIVAPRLEHGAFA